jgi:hypothetical protein
MGYVATLKAKNRYSVSMVNQLLRRHHDWYQHT